MWEYNVKVIRVIDADTLHVQADLGFSCFAEVSIRLDRIDAWEITEARGMVARTYVANLLTAAHAVRIVSRHQDKYGRWLAEVNVQLRSTDAQWLNLNNDLVAHSHAKFINFN
jgi:endonuclease YncB( thermonuclease family)